MRISPRAERLRKSLIGKLDSLRTLISGAIESLEENPPVLAGAEMFLVTNLQPVRQDVDKLEEVMVRDEKINTIFEEDDEDEP